ncbi:MULTISPECIES: MerR family transcriptional regulator [Pseudomonas]|jgi:DNA-binding transcriptional MerR regulator|uniref:MerR family DNA-binding transcriptional regulator n=1 Tax=Pseudomonas kribbensis TaxID=1628086 RepID=A0A345RYU6_9PSED|nr:MULTISPECIES: MerR family transcriptional regulator [Pseudomonas]AXI64462.1 MerR family DNA-binding transcriptional regulator [Pseudomonas kribbensis]MCX2546089.1 MerR family transcriptional regulator [Pseudomonas sp. COW5]RIJ09992.1 MerR family transcriptional regulator [Pseudomonas sp. 91RF]
MKIGELAQQSGLSASSIRFYEAQGLIPKVERLGNGYRRYPPQVLQTLNIIRSAQQAGFSLEELKQLLPAAGTGEFKHEELVEGLTRKVEQIEVMQQHLAQSKARLLEVIDSIQSKPEGMSCGANAERVLASIYPES